MKEIIKYVLLTLLINLTSKVYGQNGFLSSNHSYEIDGNYLELFSEANFSIGYANTCPRLDTFAVSTSDNIVTIDLFYDLRGVWPQSGCTSHDTNIIFLDTNFNSIFVNTITISYGASIKDSIYSIVQTDTLVKKTVDYY